MYYMKMITSRTITVRDLSFNAKSTGGGAEDLSHRPSSETISEIIFFTGVTNYHIPFGVQSQQVNFFAFYIALTYFLFTAEIFPINCLPIDLFLNIHSQI